MIRKAKINDINFIHSIIKNYNEINSCILYKNKKQIRDSISGYLVIEEDDNIIGCGQIEKLPCFNFSEIKAFCIEDQYCKSGYGSILLKQLLAKSKTSFVFVVTTYPVVNFFEKNGFKMVGGLDEIIKRKKTKYYKEVSVYPKFCKRIQKGDCPGVLLEYLIYSEL